MLVCRTVGGMATLDPDDPRPPYLQVAAALREAIESGSIPRGGQVPSYGQIAQDYGVSLGTARSAIAVLRSEGLLVTRHGKGSFVRMSPDEAGPASAGELAELRDGLDALSGRVAALERKLAD